jgi:hypothetical protein
MDFVRHGMQGAQPRFQKSGIMENAADICTFHVCDATGIKDAEKDGQCYRYDIDGISHPDAHLIAAAPELLSACQRLLDAYNGTSIPEVDLAIEYAEQIIAKAKGETP